MTKVKKVEDWLLAHEIDISYWGKNGTKTVNDLIQELKLGECTLTADSYRLVTFVSLAIFQKAKVLIELEQVLSDGSVRKRNKLPAEKVRQGESIVNTVIRCLKEELGLNLSQYHIIKKKFIGESTYESKSYINLQTKYIQHRVYIETKNLPLTSFSTKESSPFADPIVEHRWEWKNPTQKKHMKRYRGLAI